MFSAVKIHTDAEVADKQLATSKPAQPLTVRCTICKWKTSGLLHISRQGFRK
jgi:hypothetical protein